VRSLALRIPPVVVVATAAAVMGAFARGFPSLRVAVPFRGTAAIAVALLGAFVSWRGVVEFRRARTTVNPMTPGAASTLVVTGIYARTRNPMYLGFAIMLLGWGIYMASPVSLLVLPGFVICMNRLQIDPEEKAMESRFGPAYEAYRRKVGRWL
jgi:protein-S-isoprenylcysteine O-methyltransferase Ste14